MAALKGVDLDEDAKKEKMERVIEEMRRIEEEQGIESKPRSEMDEFSAFGIAVIEGGNQ